MAGTTLATLANGSKNLIAPKNTLYSASILLVCLACITGCSLFGSKNGEADKNASAAKLMTPPEAPDLIREAAAPRGLNPIEIVGVGLINSLPETGGPADPSPYRDQLVEEMRRNDVKGPNELLESSSNAVVRVRGTIPAGARRGDKMDLRVDAPVGSNASNLNGGWLLDTRMRVQQTIQGRVRKGDVMGMGTGPVLTRFSYEGTNDEQMKTEGVILGGGQVQKSRKMGFVIRPEFQHVQVSKDISGAINRRFFFFDGSTRRGVSKPIEDDYIELELHPRYEESLARYISVVRAITIDERKSNDQARLQKLAMMLENPATAADAALQLEALGESAIPTLIAATESENEELRFYAAESLAYLDRIEAIAPLEDAITHESAFRYPALAALKGFEHPAVVDALERLFQQKSVETRYGAFDAIRGRKDAMVVLAPEPIGKTLRYYQVDSEASPVVVMSARKRGELVVFGTPDPIQIDGFLLSSGGIIVKQEPTDATKVRVSYFRKGHPDRRAVVAQSVRGIAEGVVSVGGTYGDIVSVLRSAKSKGQLGASFAIDPLPKALRTYYREDGSESESDPGEDDSEYSRESERRDAANFVGSGLN